MSTGERITVLDGWRGLAILLVLVGHFTFSSWVWEERMGVDVFFVLSGMLMSNILFVERIALKDFYVRRFSRVAPALFVFLCAAFLLAVLLEYEFQFSEFFASLFFIRTYFPAEPEYFLTPLPTGHLWSLSVEEHSYIVMSLISLVLLARGKIALALLGVYTVSVVINVVNYIELSDQAFAYSQIRTESAIGFIAFSAAYNLLKLQRNITLPQFTSLFCVVLAFVCYVRIFPVWLTFVFCPILLGIAVNHLSDSAKAVRSVLNFAPLRYLGVLSYSIYLWQQIFYKLYYVLPYGLITGFFVSIFVGAGSYYIIENPLRNYINRRWSPSPVYRGKR